MRAIAFLTVLVGGCTWVSDADLAGRLQGVDDDGDGFKRAQDCNDGDASVFPGADEVWYNGIDDDCAGDDDYDQDGDGFVANEYAGLPTLGVPTSGQLDAGDCDDTEAGVNPDMPDEWYDGIDTDCAGNDDYDQDADGYVVFNGEGAPTRYVDGSGSLPGGDCDDEEPAVRPGLPDAWYDGVDTDCAGNDDYDQDEDSHVLFEYANLTTRYVAGSGGLPADDCDDRADVGALSYPGAPDEWYDGVDTDCAGDDDYDQDGDLFVQAVHAGLQTLQGETALEGTGALPTDDCDDLRADVNPEGVEQVTDPTDIDCDGDPAAFPMGAIEDYGASIASLVWSGPDDLVFDANSDDIYLSLRTTEVEVTRFLGGSAGSPSSYYESAFAFAIDRDDPAGGVINIVDWWRFTGGAAPYTLTDGHDFIAGDDALYGAIGLQLSNGRAVRLAAYPLPTGPRKGGTSRLAVAGVTSFADFSHISMDIDSNGDVHAVACESTDSVLHYLRASPTSLEGNSLDEQELYEGISLSTCELDGDGTVLGRGTSGLSEWSFNPEGLPPAFTETGSDSGYAPNEIESLRYGASSWTVLADALSQDIVILDTAGVPTIIDTPGTPTSLHASFVNGGADQPDIVVSFATVTGEAWFVRYDPVSGTSDSFQLDAGITATDVAVWVDTQPSTGQEFLIAAVSGANDVSFGWAWY